MGLPGWQCSFIGFNLSVGSAQPTGNAIQDCLVWADDSANTQTEGLVDASCTAGRPFLCERPVA